MFSRFGSRLFLALVLIGGGFILANSFLSALLTDGGKPSLEAVAWGLGLALTLVLGVPGLLLVLNRLLRPYRQLEAFARQARNVTGETQHPEEANFVLETFRSAVGQLQAQRRELEKLNEQVNARADSAERLSAQIVASVPSGLVAFDAEGRVTLLNEPAQRLLAASADSPGMHARVLLRAAPHLLELVEDCLHHGALYEREEILLRCTDGRQCRLGASVGPLGPEPGGALCLFTDLTEVTHLREQVALKKNLENLGEMSAGLAHEFKNALAALQSYAQLIQKAETLPTSHDAASEMLSEVRQLSELVTTFLNFARPRPLQLSETCLREALEDCLEELAGLYDERGVVINISGEFIPVQADERMLRQALLNLLRNAAEAIEPEQPRREVWVCGTHQRARGKRPAKLVLTIEDTGTGLTPETLERAFIPFFTTKDKGHGIGLALAHRVITQHGGALIASNTPSGGAVFKVELPLL
jgi:signal transduction histidine kinase